MLFLQFRDLKQSHYSMNDNDQLYGQFLAFAKEHRKAAITKALEIKPDDEPNETVILLKTLNMFAEQNGPETFFLDDCILVHLPLSEQLQLFEKWCDDDYFFCWGPMMFDAMKMAHRLWPQFAKYDWRNPPTTYPMRELYRCFEGAFERLRKLHPKNAGNNQQHGRKHERYPCFTLMGLLPLMDKDDEGVQIFEHAAALPYSDAQEGLIFAAAHFDLTNRTHLDAVRRVFQLWQRGDHIGFDSGTGMLGQLDLALSNWERKGFNWRADPVLGPILIPLQRNRR